MKRYFFLFLVSFIAITLSAQNTIYDFDSKIEVKKKEKLVESPYSIFGDNTAVLQTKHEDKKDHTLKIPIINNGEEHGVFKLDFQTGIVSITDKEGNLLSQAQLDEENSARFTTIDPHAEKYYSWSPYVYCYNNPLKFIDPDGKDSYLFVWFSEDDETGHAGIAIDNYKRQEVKDKNGNVVKDSKGNVQYEMVKYGTMTYYDLWPHDQVGMVSELQKNVKPDYSKGVQINSLSDLISKDPTGSRRGNVGPEGRAADGIVQIQSTFEQDSKILTYASSVANAGRKYNASSFNCSTYAENALKTAFPQLDASQQVNVPFPLSLKYNDTKVTAPNNLYNAAMKLPGATNISGPTSVVAKPYLQYFGK